MYFEESKERTKKELIEAIEELINNKINEEVNFEIRNRIPYEVRLEMFKNELNEDEIKFSVELLKILQYSDKYPSKNNNIVFQSYEEVERFVKVSALMRKYSIFD